MIKVMIRNIIGSVGIVWSCSEDRRFRGNKTKEILTKRKIGVCTKSTHKK